MRVDELDFELPADRIATQPAEPRDAARLMVVRKQEGQIEHHHVRDLPDLLHPDDLLIWNDSGVLAARLQGHRAYDGVRGGGHVEGLFIQQRSDSRWLARLSAGGRLTEGEHITLTHGDHKTALTLIEREGDAWIVEHASDGVLEDMLDQCGFTPLPPYIRKARQDRCEEIDDSVDRTWYRTSYQREDRRGSIAAPTAGLHFTPDLIERMTDRGIGHAAVTLHVGEGTFLPVKTETLEAHPMHQERWHVDGEALKRLIHGPGPSGRIVAVGTTTVRVLESLARPLPEAACSGTTDLLIAPGHQFRRVDAMMTNFHLPRSTLLALVGAFLGMQLMARAYQIAIEQKYRFYSYGDAMLLLP
ncbi:MAG: tRNA preQ1(34) S-adenosylmethionine ribosyltransferase-isomerase QueA [Phycisphaerales bacterium]|nr:tRNA preQ1(34) S-adenosylmethionine ribosyltransferase-isomerase QueA [Phycisphaerales bacterium]